MLQTYQRGDFEVSTDPERLDFEAIHHFLSTEAPWARGIERETLARAMQHSLCFGLYTQGQQIGFARVTSDYATYAYLNDVFILASYRGAGLGQWLMRCILAHPDLQGLQRFMLTTRDGQAFYGRFGFNALRYPERHLERLAPGYYDKVP